LVKYAGEVPYMYRSVFMEKRDYSNLEKSIVDFFNTILGWKANNLLIGFYRNNKDSVGDHQDLSEATAVLSLGK
jgi:alkylated DNA repair dioxygenase AlkB